MSTMDIIVGSVVAVIFLYVIYLLLRETTDTQRQDEQIEVLNQKLLVRKVEILNLLGRIRVLEHKNEQLRKESSGNSKE